MPLRAASVAVVLAFATLAAAATPAPAAAAAQLEALVAPHFAADAPGAAVLVRKGNRVLLRKAWGMADLELDVALAPEHVFRLGSLTKQFTATAILMLAEQHKLALGDDLRKYVDFPTHGATITIEQLLTHTSGIPNYTEQPGFETRSRYDMTHAEVLALVKDLPLDFAPGTKWKYSNTGYYLLGMIIEKASGEPYARFLEEHIFAPLGMSHTTYGDNARIIRGRVAGYARAGEQIRNADPLGMDPPFAAGGLVSSVDDLARWDEAIARGKLLSKASWARMFTSYKLKNGEDTHYGYGWGIGTLDGDKLEAHGGGINGFNTFILRVPEQHLLVTVLCNSAPAPTSLDELALKLAMVALGKPIVEPKVAAVDAPTLDRWAAVYQPADDDKARVVVRRDGDHLTAQRSGAPRLELWPSSPTQFFVKGSLLRFTFGARGFDVTRGDGTVRHRLRTDEPLPAARAAVAVAPALLDRCVGRYQLAPGFILAVTREGDQLFAQATGQPRFAIFPTSPTEFFLKVVDAQLSFHLDAHGRADQLTLHQNGRDLPAHRVE